MRLLTKKSITWLNHSKLIDDSAEINFSALFTYIERVTL